MTTMHKVSAELEDQLFELVNEYLTEISGLGQVKVEKQILTPKVDKLMIRDIDLLIEEGFAEKDSFRSIQDLRFMMGFFYRIHQPLTDILERVKISLTHTESEMKSKVSSFLRELEQDNPESYRNVSNKLASDLR